MVPGIKKLLLMLAFCIAIWTGPGIHSAQANSPTELCASGKICRYLPLMLKSFSSENPCSTDMVDISNPGFENNMMGWAFDSWPTYDMVVSQPYHCGSHSVQLGITDRQTASITQYVFVPKDRTMLRYWQYVDSQDVCPISGWYYDRATISVNDIQESIYNVCGPETMPNQVWQRLTFDMSGYAGQTVKLKVEFLNDDANPSLFYLDDFAFVTNR